MRQMKILWLCGVPQELQSVALAGKNVGACAAWSWVMGHLPPPDGVELHIACPAKNIAAPIETKYRGTVFHLFPHMRGAVYTLYRSWMPGFRQVSERLHPDWVHGWGTEAGFGSAALCLNSDRGIVEIQGILSDYRPHMRKSLPLFLAILNERMTLRKASRLLAESEYSAAAAKKHTCGKVGIIPQPLRADFLQIDSGPKNGKQVVFLCALNDRKGVKDAIAAFAQAASSEWTLLCVGRGTSGDERAIDDSIKELKMQGRIRMCGNLNVTEIVRLFRNSPVFLLPTYMDTGPTALKEALAMGLWPVCYDNSGPRELIGRYRYGSLSMTGNIPALAESLRKALVERPWEDAARMRGCVERVRHDLSRETIWKQLTDCYTEGYWLR